MDQEALTQLAQRMERAIDKLDGFERRLKRIEDFLFKPPVDPRGPADPNEPGPMPLSPSELGRQLNGLKERLGNVEASSGTAQEDLEEIKRIVIRMEAELAAMQEALNLIDRAAGAAF